MKLELDVRCASTADAVDDVDDDPKEPVHSVQIKASLLLYIEARVLLTTLEAQVIVDPEATLTTASQMIVSLKGCLVKIDKHLQRMAEDHPVGPIVWVVRYELLGLVRGLEVSVGVGKLR